MQILANIRVPQILWEDGHFFLSLCFSCEIITHHKLQKLTSHLCQHLLFKRWTYSIQFWSPSNRHSIQIWTEWPLNMCKCFVKELSQWTDSIDKLLDLFLLLFLSLHTHTCMNQRPLSSDDQMLTDVNDSWKRMCSSLHLGICACSSVQ